MQHRRKFLAAIEPFVCPGLHKQQGISSAWNFSLRQGDTLGLITATARRRLVCPHQAPPASMHVHPACSTQNRCAYAGVSALHTVYAVCAHGHVCTPQSCCILGASIDTKRVPQVMSEGASSDIKMCLKQCQKLPQVISKDASSDVRRCFK